MSDIFAGFGIIIPLVAIGGSLAIPLVAIILDYRRRRLQFEERRAMIEKGMVPPALNEDMTAWAPPTIDLASVRARSLRTGIIMVMLGIGMLVVFFLQQYYFSADTLPWPVPRWGLGLGGAIVGFLGLGNLIYYAVSGKKEPEVS